MRVALSVIQQGFSEKERKSIEENPASFYSMELNKQTWVDFLSCRMLAVNLWKILATNNSSYVLSSHLECPIIRMVIDTIENLCKSNDPSDIAIGLQLLSSIHSLLKEDYIIMN
jgi:hypothetical protein